MVEVCLIDFAGDPPEGWRQCRVCVCWEFNACFDDVRGPCWWVGPDLCSHCATE